MTPRHRDTKRGTCDNCKIAVINPVRTLMYRFNNDNIYRCLCTPCEKARWVKSYNDSSSARRAEFIRRGSLPPQWFKDMINYEKTENFSVED